MTNQKVFELLKGTSKKHPLTAQFMANKLETKIFTVRKAIYSLRRQGVKVKANSKGYYLSSRKDKLSTMTIHSGPYRIVIRDGQGKKIKDVMIHDKVNDVKDFTVTVKLLSGKTRRL